MPLDRREQDRLDDLEFMHGPVGGPLALAMDRVTDVMAVVAQHRVYCRVEKGKRAGEASLDVEAALAGLEDVKSLLRSAMRHLSRTESQADA